MQNLKGKPPIQPMYKFLIWFCVSFLFLFWFLKFSNSEFIEAILISTVISILAVKDSK